jgi:protein-histidine pros-kinase
MRQPDWITNLNRNGESRLQPTYVRLSRVTALLALLIGCIVLVGGWALHFTRLKSLIPNAPTMKPNTALGLICAAASLLPGSVQRKARLRGLTVFSNALVVVIGALTLGEYITGRSFGIDELLFRDPASVGIAAPGRPSEVTATCFVLLGTALFLRGRPATLLLSQCLTIATAVLSLASLIGYMYGVRKFVGNPFYPGIAVHTSLAFVLLSVSSMFSTAGQGLMRSLRGEAMGSRMARTLLPLAIAVPLVLGWLRWEGQLAGYYDTGFGVALYTTANIVCFTALIWISSGQLNRLDAARARVLRDLHESEKRAVAARAEERFRLSFEQAPVGMALIDTDGTWVRANRSLCELTGYAERELLALNYRITHPGDIEETNRLVKGLLSRQFNSCLQRKRYIRKDGQIVYALVTVSAIGGEETGEKSGFVAHMVDMTAREKAEQALRESEMRFRDLLESAPDAAVIVDQRGRIVLVNSQTEKVFGYPRADLLGQQFEMLLPEPFRELHVRHRGVYCAAPKTCPMGASRELFGLRKDGSGFPVEIALSPLYVNGELWVRSSIRDITERRKMEAEYRESQERFLAAFDQTFQFIGLMKTDGILVRANRTALEFAGIRPEDVVGMPLWETPWFSHSAELVSLIQQATRSAAAGETVRFEVTHYDAAGVLHDVDFSLKPLRDEDGHITMLIPEGRDVTERKRMEQELKTSRALAVETARLSALGQLSAGIAHEVNNPLAIISGMARTLLRMADRGTLREADVRRNAARITETAERIAKIVKSLRHIARDDSREDFRNVSVREVVEECLELCREQFRVHSIDLICPEIDPALTIRSREAQIAQILLNLLQNAYDAAVESAGQKWVRLDVTIRDSFLLLSVTDSGTGIPAEVRPRIMEPFFTTKPVGKGTGLGLSISRSIAEAHSGSLELCAGDGHTKFVLTLPLAGVVEPDEIKSRHTCG